MFETTIEIHANTAEKRQNDWMLGRRVAQQMKTMLFSSLQSVSESVHCLSLREVPRFWIPANVSDSYTAAGCYGFGSFVKIKGR